MSGKRAIEVPGLPRAMERRGLSKSELSRASGVPTQTVSRIVRDCRCSPANFAAISKALEKRPVLKASDELLEHAS